MTARTSSEPRILYSLPSSLISVPPYLLTSTRSPFLTSNGTFLPLSSVLPVPSATTTLSIGFSLAVSGIMIPPFFSSFSSTGSTRIRSPSGLTFRDILGFGLVVVVLNRIKIPPHPRRVNVLRRDHRARGHPPFSPRVHADVHALTSSHRRLRRR